MNAPYDGKEASPRRLHTAPHSGTGETAQTMKRPVVAGDKGGGRNQRGGGAQNIFRAVKVLWRPPSWRMHVTVRLSKPVGCATPGASPTVNHGPGDHGMSMLGRRCQRRLIGGEAVGCVGARGVVPSSRFCC